MNANKKHKDIFNIKEIREILDRMDRPLAFRRVLVNLTGSVQAALMLSQAIYWQERATQKDGWWYKTVEEWEEETGLSRYEQETARKKNKKYLLSDLRNAPARLYWKVDRDKLKAGLLQLRYNYFESSSRENPAQFVENPQTSLGEIQTQVGENNQTSYSKSHQLDGDISANINMYTENTSENASGINAEITTKNTAVEEEAEKEKEKEKEEQLLLLLIQGCSRALPEEDPADVKEFITRAVEIFPAEWLREAINASALLDKRSLRGILEILGSWKEHGHATTSSRTLADYAAGLGPRPE